jgi:hypothetical protein
VQGGFFVQSQSRETKVVHHTKVLFRLEQDEDGYSPFGVEGVWAEQTKDGKFVLDNIPSFARQATLGDIVEVAYEDGEPFYASTLARSGNSLVRVVFFEGHDPTELRSKLKELGCSTELFKHGA